MRRGNRFVDYLFTLILFPTASFLLAVLTFGIEPFGFPLILIPAFLTGVYLWGWIPALKVAAIVIASMVAIFVIAIVVARFQKNGTPQTVEPGQIIRRAAMAISKQKSRKPSGHGSGTTVEASESANPDLLWKQYALHVDLYKFYFDALLKVHGVFFTLSAALIAFFVSREEPMKAKIILMLPCLLGFFISAITIYGARLLAVTREEMFAIRDRLELDTAPDFLPLGMLLRAAGLLYFAVALFLLALILGWPDSIANVLTALPSSAH